MSEMVQNRRLGGPACFLWRSRSDCLVCRLHAAHQGGGLFIPTNRPYQMGDQVYMLLTLMEETNKLPISGRVVWITPAGSQGNRQQGIGVQFDETESAAAVRLKIEGILGNAMKSTRQTHTM
jgi:type IV pilus assembly protein PilZ